MVVNDQGSDVSGEEQFTDTVFPAEIEEIVNGRSSFLDDRGPALAAIVQALRTVRDFEERIALKQRQHKRIWFSELSGKLAARLSGVNFFPAVLTSLLAARHHRAGTIRREIAGYQKTLQELKQFFKLPESWRPSTRFNLIGLAFSGGGIRSATFNLGILQGLADLGILRFFDYLSTVSGGGYIGSWLSAWIWHERTSAAGGFATVTAQLRPALSARERQAENAPAATVGEYPPQCGPDPIFHLRRYSNYLTPRVGFFSQDTWTGIATYVRNLLLIQLMLVPVLAIILLFPRVLARVITISDDFWLGAAVAALLLLAGIGLVSISSALNRFRKPTDEHFHLLRFLLSILVPAVAAAFLFSWIFGLHECQLPEIQLLAWLRAVLEKRLGGGVYLSFVQWGLVVGALNVAIYILCAVIHRGDKFHGTRIGSDFVSGLVGGALLYALLYVALREWAKQDRIWDVISFGPPLFLIILLLAITVQVGLRAVTESDAAREWRGSMGAWLLISALFWAGLCALSFYGPLGWEWLGDAAKTKTALITGWLGSTLATVLAGKSPNTGNSASPSKAEWVIKFGPIIAVLGLLIAIATVSHKIVTHWSPPSTEDGQGQSSGPAASAQKLMQAEIGGTLRLGSEAMKVAMSLKPEQASNGSTKFKDYWKAVKRGDLRTLGKFLGLCLFIAALLACRVDVNEFSLHAAYRNRLVRCYLGASRGRQRKPDPITGFDPEDDFPLSKLRASSQHRGDHYDGPYLVINTALNQMAGKELAWQQRKATSFVLTPRFCGSGETGYKKTEDFCGCMELGTAFAISGAAVSPNMGYHSSGPIAFLLTLFNVRLGWWVRNPKKDGQSSRRPRPVRFPYLVSELFGQTTDDSKYVYLSDGGHFENLGIYELVRRRCKYIVCCDAGADPKIGFEDLGNAIRKIRTDLGVSIEIDLDMIRREAGQRHSRWHQAIGTIRYDNVDADESVGMLVYIKSSLSGDEPGDVLEHATQHASFPHDTTADQFFDESQFESYRRLGEHVAWEVFRCAQAEKQKGAVPVFNALRHHWVSMPPRLRESFLGQQEALVRLEAKLRDDPELVDYASKIYPEIETLLGPGPSSKTSSDPRAVLHYCNMQLDLMENVFLALELEKYHSYAVNRGWMNLFRRWAMTETFQKLWPGLRGGYSRQFVDFIEEHFLPCAQFQIVGGIPAGLVQRLAEEFKLDQLSAEIAPKFSQALKGPVALKAGVAGWFAVPNSEGSVTEAWGVAVVSEYKNLDSAKSSEKYDYQLYVWVRGAYRNLGIGGKLLDEALSALEKNFSGKTLLVDLGEEKPGNPSHQQRKAAWLRLYGQRGFIRKFGDGKRLRLMLQL